MDIYNSSFVYQPPLKLRDDQSAYVVYNIPDFPVAINYCKMSYYPEFSSPIHWHNDIELIYIVSGQLVHRVNDEVIELHRNEGLFTNSRQLHSSYTTNNEECFYISVVFHPQLLCATSEIENKYVLPIIENDSLPYVHLMPSVPWHKSILDNVKQMYTSSFANFPELKLQGCIHNIWWELYSNVTLSARHNSAKSHNISILKSMTFFIESHYKEKLSLSDIAAAGSVSKTTCNSIFKKYTNQTPVEYLTSYRLQKSIELMSQTDWTITEICYSVGFSGASYFTEIFSRSFGCSPSKFRERI